ncbi:MAG TPA: hypothetical protein VGP44_11825 [Gemmatimonadales bacterium]|nr:hypothetical protein [Gemmatimonadales bacterium]
MLWIGCTVEVEILLALALALRALWMLSPWWSSLPLDTQGYLIPAHLPEWGYGLILLGCALGQLLAASRQSLTGRAVVAAMIAVFQSSVLVAYWQSGYFYRAVVPFIVAIVLGEWWLSWRAWTDRFSTPMPDRRGHG